MDRILIVDDELQMRQLLTLYLRQYTFQIDEANDGQKAYEKIKEGIQYDLILLDIMMPNMDGFETLKKIRELSDVPVIMLTAKGNTDDKVTGLASGADDYLVKPFEEAELIARIKALLRRTKKRDGEEKILKYNDITLNLTSREVYYKDQIVRLTQTEFDLLQIFVENRGRVFSREELIEFVWGIEFSGEDRTIDSHIRNIRSKFKEIGFDGWLIQTVWGVGYKLQ